MIRRAVLIVDNEGNTLVYSPDAAITIDMEKITICIRHDEISSPVGRYEVWEEDSGGNHIGTFATRELAQRCVDKNRRLRSIHVNGTGTE
jgi:hypothetical protein